MRRFNLTKPAMGSDPDEEAVPEMNAAPPSRRRVFLLALLLVVVVALGAKNFIGTYVWRESGTPLPATGRIAGSPAEQALRPSPAPQKPAAVATLEPPAKPAGLAGAPEPELPPKTPPGMNERVPRAALRGGFSVQVGAMAREANALALRKRLEKLGYAVAIRQRRASVTEHVVLVEGPSDKSGTDAMMERLKAEGMAAVVSESNGRYRVEAGRSVVLDQAIDLAHELQKKGFTPRIASETGTNTVYRVRVGEFASQGEAAEAAKELREKGFSAFIVTRKK